jgi:hypothetical protein
MGPNEQDSKNNTSMTTPITVTAYSIVPVMEEVDENERMMYGTTTTTTATTNGLDLSRPATTTSFRQAVVDPRYSYLPETKDLQWQDNFFHENDYDNIIAVFDFDYQNMEVYYQKVGWCLYGSTIVCCGGLFWTGTLLGVPCYLNRNVKWNVWNQHVAFTRTGVMFVHDQRPSCWGWACTDIKQSTILVSTIVLWWFLVHK